MKRKTLASNNNNSRKISYPKKSKNKYVLAAKAMKRQSQRVKLPPGELNFIDINFASAAMTTTNALQVLNTCTQGDDATNRTGRKISVKSIFLRGYVTCPSTSTTGGIVRIKIVWDSQANGSAPSATDIFVTDNAIAANNLNNRERFKTLMEETLPVSVATGGPAVAYFERYIDVNMETIFNSGNAGTVADIQTGSIYLLHAYDGVATTAPNMRYYVRTRFSG